VEIYFFMLAVPSALVVLRGRRESGIVTSLVFLTFVFLMGFRFNVGMDWNNYESIHSYIGRSLPADLLLGSEPLSTLIFWVSDYFGVGSLLSNVLAAGMLMFGVLSFARRTASPWLAVVAATPFLIIAFGMSGIRQAMAAGVLLYGMSVWEESGTVKKSIIVLFASLFHTSAVMAILFVLWDLRIRLGPKTAIMILAAPSLYYGYQRLDSYSENIQFYQDVYMAGAGGVVSPGALYHIALVGLPAGLYFAYRRRFSKYLYSNNLVFMGAWAVVAIFFLYFFSSTGASRLSMYLYFVPMAIYSGFPSITSREDRLPAVVGILGVHFALLAGWFVYANNSFAHLPYRNIMFESALTVFQ
jgi:hypothetical protein